jgi:hypothetical protein
MAEKRWRRIRSPQLVKLMLEGAKFLDGRSILRYEERKIFGDQHGKILDKVIQDIAGCVEKCPMGIGKTNFAFGASVAEACRGPYNAHDSGRENSFRSVVARFDEEAGQCVGSTVGGCPPSQLPPLLTETNRYDRFCRNSSMKSRPTSPCQRGGRRFAAELRSASASRAKPAREPGLVLQITINPVRHLAWRG